MDFLPQLLVFLPLLIFSVVLHEVCHGLVAQKFGDDTAYIMGRLTLNPLPHMDMIGSLLLPVLCVVTGTPLFGWAKPVPINPNRFTHYRSGMIWVSLAGPLANLALACAGAVALALAASRWTPGEEAFWLQKVFSQAVLLNLVLFVFNLLPIPPLDGSKVFAMVLPRELAAQYERIEPYGFYVLMALIFLGVLGRIVYPLVLFLYHSLLGAVGL